MKLLQEPVAEPQNRIVSQAGVPAALPHRPLGHVLRDGLHAAWEFTLNCVMASITLAVQFLLYAVAVLAVPLGTFLLPLLLGPVVLLWGLVILGAGKVLAALGLLL